MSPVCLFQDRFDPDKPYNVCIECTIRAAKHCDGPNALSMTPERRCEFLQDTIVFNKRRDGVGWSYEHIAERTNGLSRSTVFRIVTDPTHVPRVDALSEVFRVVLDGSWGEFPCGIHATDEQQVAYVDSPETLELVSKLRDALDGKDAEIAKTKAELESVKVEHNTQIAHLYAQLDRKDDYIDRLAKKVGI